MWKLKHTKKDFIEHSLFVGEDFSVGRKDASLLLASDPSVSRRHAVLYLKHPEENLSNPSKKSSLFLRDEGSKYGTFKNGSIIKSEVELVENDVIKFGQFDSEFRVRNIPLVVTTSCLENSAKKELRKTIHFLGGNLISEWQPICSHLVMTEVKVTVKALCCLVSTKPIVKPEYFQELKRSLKTSATIVPPNQFIPPVGESLIDKDTVSFDINHQRKSLFNNKTFFFLDEKQFKKLHLGIILGGGSASILTKECMDPELLVREDCCVIESTKESLPSQDSKSLLSSVATILETKKLRMIPESDVGLAVTYCSTEKFCNPRFDMVEVLRSQKIQSQTLTQREVYVPDTEERTARVEVKTRNIVEDFCSSLHLSSFQAGPVQDLDLSEVPLSAQVKRELDELFDEPFEEEITEAAPPPSPPRREVRTSKRTRRSSPQQNGNNSTQQISSPARCNGVQKTETKPTLTTNSSPEQKPVLPLQLNSSSRINGFHEVEAELPRNLANIEFAALICIQSAPAVQRFHSSSGKNFKKFRKNQPKRVHALPRIIGAHELVPFDKIAAEIANAVWDEAPEEMSQPVKGEFDW